MPHKPTFLRGGLTGTRALSSLLPAVYLPGHRVLLPRFTTAMCTTLLLPSSCPQLSTFPNTAGREGTGAVGTGVKREHSLPRNVHLPCTTPQGYCLAFAILLPIFTSSVLPTTANGRWTCEATQGQRGVTFSSSTPFCRPH